MAEEKEWGAGELNRLVATLKEAKAEMRNEELDKAKEYTMRFFIYEKHLRIDLSKIDFGSLRGNNVVDLNDGSIMALVEKTSGDKEEGGSDVAEDVEEVCGPQSMPEETAKDPSLINAKVSLPPSENLCPFPMLYIMRPLRGLKICKKN